MTQLRTSQHEIRFDGRPRPSLATLLGTAALVTWAIPGALSTLVGIASGLTVVSLDAEPDRYLAAVAANPAAWNLMGGLLLLTALLTMAWAPAVWRLTVGRTRAWAWVAGVAASLFAFGQAVHLMSWQATIAALARSGLTGAQANAYTQATDGIAFFWVIFAPFLVGFVVAPALAAVALWRARLVPVWSFVAVLVVSILGVLFGDSMAFTVVHPVVIAAAFAPALVHVVRERRGVTR